MKKGFTLIELAMVLIIIGILLGGGISVFGILTKRSKVKETQNIIDQDVQIVKTFVANQKRLPSSDEFKEIAKTQDIWDKTLGYKYAKNLTEENSICYENSTPLEIKICKNKDCSEVEDTVKNVAFLILSPGENLNSQTDLSTDTVKIYLPGIKTDDNTSDSNIEQPYDDIVKWATLNELKQLTDCKEEKLHILNNEIPYGFQNSAYDAKIYAQGGLVYDSGGKYAWCYEGDLPSGLTTNPNYHSTDCMGSIDFWKNADYFNITGTPTEPGNYKITVYVKDKNENVDKRSYVLTINP